MRHTGLVIFLVAGAAIQGQSLVESAAAAAGGSVGGVAGKKVSDGLTNIFNKIDKQTEKAAKQGEVGRGKNAPLLEVGPGTVRAGKGEFVTVPPPPPLARHVATRKTAPPPQVPQAVEPEPEPVVVTPPPPPPPEMTADGLKTVIMGMRRAEVLKLGEPAMRITMADEGHLLETYRYMAKGIPLGVVHLTDGAVSSVSFR
jgi:hypothetical protein